MGDLIASQGSRDMMLSGPGSVALMQLRWPVLMYVTPLTIRTLWMPRGMAFKEAHAATLICGDIQA